jgi:hypothetical protein
MKNSERKWNERKRNLYPLLTMDTDSLSTEVSNVPTKVKTLYKNYVHFRRIKMDKKVFRGAGHKNHVHFHQTKSYIN